MSTRRAQSHPGLTANVAPLLPLRPLASRAQSQPGPTAKVAGVLPLGPLAARRARSHPGPTAKVLCLQPLLALAGCTLLYEPSKQLSPACPQPPTCAARANACADSACRFTCSPGFADLDGDLNVATGSTGCEARCDGAAPAAHPAQLTATAGAASGALRWDWPSSAGAAVYRLCRGSRCAVLAADAVCAQGQCSTTTTDDVDGVRVEGQVEALGRCGEGPAAAGAPRASQVPFAFLSTAGWTTTAFFCSPQLAVAGGALAITQTPLCASYLLVGDGEARDGTLEVEVRFDSALGTNALLGLVLRAGQSERLVALTAPLAAGDELSTQLRVSPDRTVAKASAAPPFDTFWRLKLVASGEVVSLSLGPDAASLREALRWYDPAPAPGRLGLAVLSVGLASVRAEFRGLTVSSATELPASGPRSIRVDFADLPDAGVRLRSAPQLEFLPCPAAAGCDAGCAPAPGTRCVKAGRSGFFNPGVAVDLPTGLDTRKPWSASLRFLLPSDAGVNAGTVISGAFGPLLGTNGKAWDAGLEVLGRPAALSLSLEEWHRAEFSFDPVAKQVRLGLDGREVPLAGDAFPPPTWDRFLGALQLGDWGFGSSSVISTDLTLSQP